MILIIFMLYFIDFQCNIVYITDILNKPLLYNREQFLTLIEKRPSKKGLVTVSNHYSCLDDPCIWSKFFI